MTRDSALFWRQYTTRQFITIETGDGNIFYLVIDYDAGK